MELILALKLIFSKTTDVCVLTYKFQVSSIILMSFRQRVNLLSSYRKPIPKKPTQIKVNIITNKDEAKTMRKHISCDCKCKFNSTIRNSSQKWNNETCQCECKNYRKCKKD